MKARDFRAQARAALKGKWWITTLLVLLALILGAGSLSNINFGNFSINLSGDPAEMQDILAAVEGSSYSEMNSYPSELEMEGIISAVLLALGGMLLVLSSVVMAYSLFLGSWVRVGLVHMLDKLLDGERPRAGMLFRDGVYWRSVKLGLLRAIFTALWTLLLIVPGIIACYRYAMAEYLLNANPGMGAREALQESGRCMRGRKWRLFCLQLSFIGWYWLLALALGICMTISLVLVGLETPVTVFIGVILLLAGVLVMLVAMLFLGAYSNTATVAFLRDVQRSASWHEQARAGEEYAEAAYSEDSGEYAEAVREIENEPFTRMGESQSIQGRGVHPQPTTSVLSADETVAKDLFMQHKCSRELLYREGLLEEYLKLNPSPISEERWKRDYSDALMRRFDQEAGVLDDLLNHCAEYALDDLLSRALQRIERHIRQQTLPDAEILNMCGRTLALLVSGRFDDNPGYILRKKEQASDMADRLEHRLSEVDPDGAWKDALALIRRMCA